MKAVLLDLDGTICDTSHRADMVKGKVNPDWEAYSLACDKDAPIQWVIDLVDGLRKTHLIVVVSGRSVVARTKTLGWFQRYRVFTDALIMRAPGDHRPNPMFKRDVVEIWNTDRAGSGQEIEFAIDDYPAVAKELALIGVPTLIVARPEDTRNGYGVL